MRRVNLAKNGLEEIAPGLLPASLSYLNVSNNESLCNIKFVAGLQNITTLILSCCKEIGKTLNLTEGVGNCNKLKVLVMDRCGLSGTFSLENTACAKSVNTIVLSHNDELVKIDLKGCRDISKLSASNNAGLKIVQNLPDSSLAELRLAHCPSLNSLAFLSKKQKKLALLDLSSSPLVKEWTDLKTVLCTLSLLTLNLKSTPLQLQFPDFDVYEKETVSNLQCKRLRTLDFKKIMTGAPQKEDKIADESDEGEEFDIPLDIEQQREELRKDEEIALPVQDPFEEEIEEDARTKRDHKSKKNTDGFFVGEKSAW